MRVSVIIPCYNAEPYLAEAIGSVLAQTRPPAEVIVVDDGSTDGSLAVAQSFGERVRVLSARLGGASLARNHGLATATGDALMFFDADDVLTPDALEALIWALAAAPSGIALCPWDRLDLSDGAWVRAPASCRPRRPEEDPLAAWLTGWYHPPCSVLWSREAFEQAGPWDQGGGPNDDGLVMMKAMAREVPVTLTGAGRAFYRRLPESAGSVSSKRFTEPGLLARIYVVEEVAYVLAERGRLGPYRLALADALRAILRDGEGRFPAVEARAEAVARRYAGLPWVRAARRLPRRLAAEWDRVRRRLPGRPLADP